MTEVSDKLRNASRTNHPWSQAEDELLGALIETGISVQSVAVTLQRTTRSIRRRSEVLKISWRAPRVRESGTVVRTRRLRASRWKAEDERKLRTLIAMGNCERDIAAQLNRSVYAVRIRASKLKVSLRAKERIAAGMAVGDAVPMADYA